MRSKKKDEKMTRSIGESLFPKIKRQLLAHFFLAPDRRHYFREITRLVNASPGAVQRELKTLTEAGILATEKVGRQQYYWADPECMIYSALKEIVVKTFGVVDLIRSALSPLEDTISMALIFGSIAAGEDKGTSDIDLLVVGDLSFRTLVVALEPIEGALNRAINPTLYNRQQFQSRYTSDNHFIHSVFGSEVIYLIGKPDDTSRLVRE